MRSILLTRMERSRKALRSGRDMLKAPSATNWEFDGFKVLTEMRLLLLGDGTPVPLTSKAFDTLVLLIANRDRVVTKDELLRSVWPDVAVEEGNLTQQIFLLRKALGESAQQPRYIVTVPGHGYRFTAHVKAISADPATTGVAMGGAASSRTARIRGSRFIGAGLVVFGTVALLAIVLGSIWMARDKAGPPLNWTNARITKVTESGKATYAAISPDGRYVAYVENDGDEYSVWVKQIATDGKTQVVPRQPLVLTYLSFSPDGEYIYFTRGTPRRGGFVLSRVPAIGGLETPILDDVDTPISFSPDGREFVFMRGAGPETHIVVAAAGGGSQRILATRKSPLAFSFFAPDWSPDGKVVAASAIDGSNGSHSIVLLPVDGGSSRELYTSDNRLGRVRWLPDGSGLLTVVSEGLERPQQFGRLSGGSIWRIGYPGGRAERLTSDLADHDPCCLDIGANGQRGRERPQFARVGPLDCAGRPPGRAQTGHVGPSRYHASQLVTGQRHDRVSRPERTSECRPERRPGVQPAVARWSQGGGRRLRLRRRPLRRLSSSPGKQHLARHAQRRRRGQTHQRLCRLESCVFS